MLSALKKLVSQHIFAEGRAKGDVLSSNAIKLAFKKFFHLFSALDKNLLN